MKRIIVFFTILLLTLPVTTAFANYVYLDPVGDLTASQGDTLSLNVYAHNDTDTDDAINMWQLSIGFDDSALGGELTYIGYTLNLTDFEEDTFSFPGTYIEGGSNEVEGASMIATIGALGPNYISAPVEAGEDILLFTITFEYTNPEYSWTGDDVWIELDAYWADAVYWDNNLDGDTDIGTNGSDFAAVPVPAAAWLLGSGLLGIMGVRRRTR